MRFDGVIQNFKRLSGGFALEEVNQVIKSANDIELHAIEGHQCCNFSRS